MILAAADFAAGKGNAPRELQWVFDHDRWGVMPNRGGLLDQPAGAVRRMRECENVYRTVRFYIEHGPEPGHTAEWQSANADTQKILDDIEELRNAKT